MRLWLHVPGSPAPQGSKSFKGFRNGRGILVESSAAVGPWRERIALAAHNAMSGRTLMTGPIDITMLFVLPRPKSAPKRTTPPAVKRPDLDKLARAVLDALTNVVFSDDSQVTSIGCAKRLAQLDEAPGLYLAIAPDDQDLNPAESLGA